jgi:cytochrome c oxidase cbb3-type subunit 3
VYSCVGGLGEIIEFAYALEALRFLDVVCPARVPVELGADGVEQVMAFVLSLSGRELKGPAGSADFVAAGKVRFTTMCSACHGADGKGNQALGAPNLTDNVWLHGGSVNDIRETMTKGRSNAIPAPVEHLGDTKVRLLAAYVLSLSRTAVTAPLAAVAPGEAHAAE